MIGDMVISSSASVCHSKFGVRRLDAALLVFWFTLDDRSYLEKQSS